MRIHYRDEINDDANENIPAGNYRINSNKTATSESFEYKAKMVEKTPTIVSRLDTEVIATLKLLSNVWRSLDLRLINSKIELNFSWSGYCVAVLETKITSNNKLK